jgi:ornithine decarboxylase
MLRIQSDETLSQIKFNQKFGADDEEIEQFIHYHKNKNYNLYGISFHVGSKCYYPEQYIKTIDKIKNLIDKHELKINTIDIGGGFPSFTEDTENNFKNHVKDIEEYIKKYKSISKYTFVGEPGRFIVDNTMTLILNIINKKQKIINNEKYNIYYINDGIYGSMNGIIFDGREIDYKDKNKQNHKTILYGQTCDSIDKIECNLPEFNIGDTIKLDNFGAYSWASSSMFNGFLLPKVIKIK